MTQNYRTTGPCTTTCNINILNAAFVLVKVTAQIKGLILQGWRYTRPRLSSCPPFVFFCIYLQRTLRSNRRLVVMDHFVNFSASILLFISWPKVECACFSDYGQIVPWWEPLRRIERGYYFVCKTMTRSIKSVHRLDRSCEQCLVMFSCCEIIIFSVEHVNSLNKCIILIAHVNSTQNLKSKSSDLIIERSDRLLCLITVYRSVARKK